MGRESREGNESFRTAVLGRKEKYVNLGKFQKLEIASSIKPG